MPILNDRNLEFISHSPDQTRRLGVRLGELLKPGDLICLAGDLGSGKTTFAQGIARGWGALDAVTSPTFVLLNQYRRADSASIYHFDAFRLRDSEEALDLGWMEVIDGGGPLLVEWPERIAPILPDERLWIALSWVEESRRRLYFTAIGEHYEGLLREYRRNAFGG